MMYIDRGAISAAEAWQERFGSGEFKYNIQLDSMHDNIEGITEDDSNFLEDGSQETQKDLEELEKNADNRRKQRNTREV